MRGCWSWKSKNDKNDDDLLFNIIPHVEALHLLPNLSHYVSLLLNLVMRNIIVMLVDVMTIVTMTFVRQ